MLRVFAVFLGRGTNNGIIMALLLALPSRQEASYDEEGEAEEEKETSARSFQVPILRTAIRDFR